MTEGARSPLVSIVAGLSFQNPILLASGTAGYGEELADVMHLERLGGLVTKAVSREPRSGALAPRVWELNGGMLNAVGLANPGVDAVREHQIEWLRTHLPQTRKIANVVGFSVEEYATVVAGLEEAVGARDTGTPAIDAFELNVSCPNVSAGGMEFGADAGSLAGVVSGVRRCTRRPVFVKLSPTLPDIAQAARVAVDAGADGISVVNTIPGMVIDVETRRPVLGFGSGGISGAALRPIGVLATAKVGRAVRVPIIGVGGVSRARDALQYIIAGASLVAIGTAALKDPRCPERIVADLVEWCRGHDIARLGDMVGTLEWT